MVNEAEINDVNGQQMLEKKEGFMAGQPTPPNVPPPEIAGLIKGLLTVGFPL